MVENGISLDWVVGYWEVFTCPLGKSEESMEGLGSGRIGGLALAVLFRGGKSVERYGFVIGIELFGLFYGFVRTIPVEKAHRQERSSFGVDYRCWNFGSISI